MAAGPHPPLPAAASTADRCEITQITDTTQDSVWDFGNQLNRESLSGDGTRLVFASNLDVVDQDPRGVDLRVYFHDVTAGETTPLTDGRSFYPVISADGSRAASTMGTSGEVFGYAPDTGDVTQLTADTFFKVVLSISADGSRILYLADVVGAGVPHSLQVLDTTTSATMEVVAAAAGLEQSQVALSPDGFTLALAARADLTGENPDGSAEVFIFDIATETFSQATSAVAGPNGGGSTGNLSFTDNGATLLFSSNAQVIDPNPTRAFGYYGLHLASDVISRRAEVPVGPPGFTVWSPDGSRVAGTTNEDPTGANPEGNYELFSHVPADNSITQLTATATTVHAGGSPYATSTNGTTIAFRATANLLGGNPDHNPDIFLATTCDPPPQPDGSIAPSTTAPPVGEDIHSSAPRADQRATATIARGATRKFFVELQNDRDAIDMLTVRGTDGGASGYQVAYLAGRTDITAQVEDGTYTVGPLEPGETTTIKVRLRATSTAGNGHRVDLLARSDTNPAARDTVRAKVTRG